MSCNHAIHTCTSISWFSLYSFPIKFVCCQKAFKLISPHNTFKDIFVICVYFLYVIFCSYLLLQDCRIHFYVRSQYSLQKPHLCLSACPCFTCVEQYMYIVLYHSFTHGNLLFLIFEHTVYFPSCKRLL